MAIASETHSEDHFDLLPFIAVLLCTLGCLLLVTLAMAAIALGPGKGETWITVPGADAAPRAPVLAEWDGEWLTVHPTPRGAGRNASTSGGRRTIRVYEAGGRLASGELEGWIRSLKDTPGAYVLFAVRPSGFHNFDSVADDLRHASIDLGYEPIEQSRRVELEVQVAPHERTGLVD